MLAKEQQQMEIGKIEEKTETERAAQGRQGLVVSSGPLGNESDDHRFLSQLDAKNGKKGFAVPFEEILESQKTSKMVWRRMELPVFTYCKVTGYYYGNASDWNENIRPGSHEDYFKGYIRFEIHHKDIVTKEFTQVFKGRQIYDLMRFVERYDLNNGFNFAPVYFSMKLGKYLVDMDEVPRVKLYGVKVPGK